MRLRGLCACALLFCLATLCAPAQDAWVFAYFKEPGTQGIYLAISHDGYHWKALNDGQPWVKPQLPGEVMRDVFLTRGPDHRFHMVWTWSWHGNSLGYAESADLLHWSVQKQIAIMKSYPEVRNVWAPETYWDAKKHEWLLIWSSSMNGSDVGNRIYSSFTPDFRSFSRPAVFFNPGYVVIDATMFHRKRAWYLVFKDQSRDPLRYQIRFTTGPTVEGPWNRISPPLTESWSEGPSVIHVGKEFIVYYDHYRHPMRYEGVESTDWRHWYSINSRILFPAHCKHGSFMKITSKEAARLEAWHSSSQ